MFMNSPTVTFFVGLLIIQINQIIKSPRKYYITAVIFYLNWYLRTRGNFVETSDFTPYFQKLTLVAIKTK